MDLSPEDLAFLETCLEVLALIELNYNSGL